MQNVVLRLQTQTHSAGCNGWACLADCPNALPPELRQLRFSATANFLHCDETLDNETPQTMASRDPEGEQRAGNATTRTIDELAASSVGEPVLPGAPSGGLGPEQRDYPGTDQNEEAAACAARSDQRGLQNQDE